jgi:hypothetical protein
MKPVSRKNKLVQHEQTAEHGVVENRQSVREFASAEELLRFDARQTTPPPGLAGRVKDSIARESVKPVSLLRRLFRKRT